MEPIIISVAPNGARKQKSVHPNIPLTADEIASTAKECMEQGATLLHMHIRDENFGHSLDVDTYRATTARVREAVGSNMIIQATTEAVGIYKPEEQMQVVRELKPESCSLAIREIIPEVSYEETAKEFLSWVYNEKIIPQYILYNEDEVKYFSDLRKRRIIPGDKVFALFVLGKKTEATDTTSSFSVPEDLDPFLECFADGYVKLADTTWTVSAFGGNENACVKYATECGGHPRIGFENNHLMANGEMAESNAALIKQFVDSSLRRPIASVEQARKILEK